MSAACWRCLYLPPSSSHVGALGSRASLAHPGTCSYMSKSIDDDFAKIVGKLVAPCGAALCQPQARSVTTLIAASTPSLLSQVSASSSGY